MQNMPEALLQVPLNLALSAFTSDARILPENIE